MKDEVAISVAEQELEEEGEWHRTGGELDEHCLPRFISTSRAIVRLRSEHLAQA